MMKPFILEHGAYNKEDLVRLRATPGIVRVVDIYLSQLEEFFTITYPEFVVGSPARARMWKIFCEELSGKESDFFGNWVFYPWNGYLIHMVAKEEYRQLRMNRNRELINLEEQKILTQFKVGVVGLSVGASIAVVLAQGGICQSIKLADFDQLSTTNLNRVDARLYQVGQSKLSITAEHLYEVDPYIDIVPFETRLDTESLFSFFDDCFKLNIIFEAVDDFILKIKLRQEARRRKVPVIMLTNLGDSVLVDVERYDLNPTYPIFHGLARDLEERIKKGSLAEEEKHRYAVSLVGAQYVPLRAQASIQEIGKKLVGRPQLMSTVAISSGLASFIARKLAFGQPLESGRYRFVVDKLFNLL